MTFGFEMQIEISSKAQRDLAHIIAFFEERSPRAAYRLSVELEKSILRLADFPKIGRLGSEFGVGVRSIVSGNYIIFYCIDTEKVTILRVIDGRRDIDCELLP